MSKSKSFAVAAGLAGAIALATSASAAPVTSGTLALKNASPNDVVQVRSRGWRGAGIGLGVGFAAGALIGAAASSSYYGGPYAYDYGYAPAYSYGYAPAYSYGYAPAYSYGYAPGPGIYAGPRSRYEYYTNQSANPTLGTVQGFSTVD